MIFQKGLYVVLFYLLTLTVVKAQSINSNEFLFSVIELTEGENGKAGVEVVTAKVVPQYLKRPFVSEKILKDNGTYFSIQITDATGLVLDEVLVNDPFIVNYEYANEENQLTRVNVHEPKITLGIRRRIDHRATKLNIVQKSETKSIATTTFKFR